MSVTLEHRWNTGSPWADEGRYRGDRKSVWRTQSLPGVTGAEGRRDSSHEGTPDIQVPPGHDRGTVAHFSSGYTKVLESGDITGKVIRKVECSSVC